MKSAVVAVLSLLLCLPLTGCETEDPTQCSYWVKRLENPSKAREALQQVGMMKCTEAGDALKKMFDEGGIGLRYSLLPRVLMTKPLS